MDEGSAIMQTTKLASIGSPRSIEMDTLIQRTLRERVPEIKQIIARTGADELGLDPMGLNETDVFLVLKPKEDWRVPDKEWLLQQMRDVMADLPGQEIAFTQPIEMRTSEMLTGARGDLAVKIFGPDLKTLAELAGQHQGDASEGAGSCRSHDGVKCDRRLPRGQDRPDDGGPRPVFPLLASRMSCGLSWKGRLPVSSRKAGRRTNIIIRGPADARDSPEQFAFTQLAAGDGGLIRASDVAKLTRTGGPVKVDRENAARFAIVQAYVSGSDLGRLCGRCAESRGAANPSAEWIPARLGRGVREPKASRGAPHHCRADCARP